MDVKTISIIDIDRDAEFIDLNRELKGICTDIVVNDFFKSEDCLYNFLLLTYKCYEDTIIKYRKTNNLKETDLFFTFKGGNILRIVYKELMLELPNFVSSELSEFYKKFFKRSDADFSIYINPRLKNYDEIYDKWCVISFELQKNIREVISNNLTDFFDYFKYNDNFSKKVLKKNFKLFENANSFRDKKNYKYRGGILKNLTFVNNSYPKKIGYNYLSDFSINDGRNDSELIRQDIGNNDSFMYISMNKSLEFKSGDGGITKFALIRTKVNFNLTIEKQNSKRNINMAGELIDVSIPHRKDKSIYEVFDKYDRAISRYTMNATDCSNSYCLKDSGISHEKTSFDFNSYSLEFLIEDLEKILFHVAEYPWDDNKYVKRLNRLCYLYFLDMFIKQDSNLKRKIKLKDTMKQILQDKKIVGDKPKDDIHELDRLIWYFFYVKNKTNNKFDLKYEFKEFEDNIHTNIEQIWKGFSNISKYSSIINGPGNIKENNIYDSSINELI